MAKLSDRQKSNIRAKFKTGQYGKADLAKSYKVDEKTIRNICKGIEPDNAHIVEAQLIIEREKKSGKSPAEVTAIDQAVKYRLEQEFNDDNNRVRVYDVTSKILDKVANIIESGHVVKLEKETTLEGLTVRKEIKHPLKPSDLGSVMNTVDKASITLNVNPRHAPKAEINNNNTNGQQTNITAPEIEGYSVEVISPDQIEHAKALQVAEDD